MRELWLGFVVMAMAACGGHNSGSGTPDAACLDDDNDGQTTCAGDCDDSDPLTFTGGIEACGDNKDNDCDGQIDEGCNGLGTWVSGATGDDANAGTQAAPVKTIAKGMANAMTIGVPQGVYVAGSHYPEKVTMVEGISLYGGYECNSTSCTWTRDAIANDTAILDQDHEGVAAGGTLTRATTIEGFRIMGFDLNGTAGFGAAISVTGAPTIANNRIFGGNVTGGANSIGVAILAPTTGSPLVKGNDITVGMSAAQAAGVAFTATAFPTTGPATAEVRANTIHGGSAIDCVGVLVGTSAATTLVAGNTITTGNSTNTGTTARGGAWGIRGYGAATIDSNHINVPPATPGTCNATDWCGGIQSESATLVITNNVVYGAGTFRSAAVRLREVEVPVGSVVVNSNYLDGNGGPAPVASNMSAAVQLEYSGCGSCGVNAIMGKLRNNILVAGKSAQRYCVLENNTTNNRTNRPEALENNVFFIPAPATAGDVLYHQWNGTAGTDLTMITQVNAITTPAAALNQNADPLLDSSWHLMTGSPCVDKGTTTEAPATDMDGDARPDNGAFDIGADEQ